MNQIPLTFQPLNSMKKIFFLLFLVILLSFLSFQFSWLGYLLLFIIFLTLAFLLIMGIISIFRQTNKQLFKVSLLILLICISGVITSLFIPYDAAIINSGSLSEKLEYAYKTDQSDRKALRSFVDFSNKVAERDSLRREQLRKIYRKQEIDHSIDKFHAAFIFHHSNNSKDFEIASRLASQAAGDPKLKDHYTVQWLHKAAYDRWMVSIGKPEKYNTQNKLSIEFD